MSFSFVVPVPARGLPSFSVVLERAQLPHRVEIVGADLAAPDWALAGTLESLSDVVLGSAPAMRAIDGDPRWAAMGVHGVFLVHAPGVTTRGVEITAGTRGVAFRVLAASSAYDYEIAVRLSAALAALTGTSVQAEHGLDGGAIGPLSPSDLLATFGPAFAERNAHEMTKPTIDDVALRGRRAFMQTARGVFLIDHSLFENAPAAEWLARSQAWLRSGAPYQPQPAQAIAPLLASDPAVLIVRGLILAAAADGVIAPIEKTLIAGLLESVPFLKARGPSQLVDAASALHTDVRSLGALPPSHRATAMVLAAEVLAATRGGAIAGDTKDKNVQWLGQAFVTLGLTQAFLQDVAVVCAAKYTPNAEAALASRLVLAMVLAAAADGQVGDAERAVIQTLGKTVPDLARHDLGALLAAAQARIAQAGVQGALADLADMPAYRNKCFILAAEVAFAAGAPNATTQAALATLANVVQPNAFDATMRVLMAKYAAIA